MRKFVGNLIIFSGIVIGIYIGIWLMIFQPFVECFMAYNNGIFTLTLLRWTLVKYLFGGIVAVGIFCVGYFLGNVIKTKIKLK